jgi:hypothetical protein
MMEHTIYFLAMAFINEEVNYHAIHGVWQEDTWGALILFLQRTVDVNTATNLVEEANNLDAEEMLEEVYEKLAHIVSCEDEMDDENYKNQH